MTRMHTATPAEYFKELIDSALHNQRLETDERMASYLVNLLCGFVRADVPGARERPLDTEPLALRFGQALRSAGTRQRIDLRRVGDLSLFISGFFADSLRCKAVDLDYYVALGGCAYGWLSRCEDSTCSSIFAQLAERFMAFVDVLAEVSEGSGLTSSADLLRLYEKWLRNGSRRDGQRLVKQGIVPNASIGYGFMQ